MPVRSRLRVHLNRKSLIFQGFAIFLLDFAPHLHHELCEDIINRILPTLLRSARLRVNSNITGIQQLHCPSSLKRNLTFVSFVFQVETLMNAVTVAIEVWG